jgi:RNase P/RNase MRP subunit POP5
VALTPNADGIAYKIIKKIKLLQRSELKEAVRYKYIRVLGKIPRGSTIYN